MLTIYENPYSQHSRRVVALLNIAGLEYRSEHVNLAEGEQMAAAFLALNPNHAVPVMVDGDLTLSESNAILRYLCARAGLTDWYPEDMIERARVDMWLDWNQCQMAQSVVDVVLNSVFLGEEGDKRAIARGCANLVDAGHVLANRLSRSAFVAGANPTIADLSIASNISQLELANAVPDHGSIHAWYARVCEVDGFRATLPPPVDAAA